MGLKGIPRLIYRFFEPIHKSIHSFLFPEHYWPLLSPITSFMPWQVASVSLSSRMSGVLKKPGFSGMKLGHFSCAFPFEDKLPHSSRLHSTSLGIPKGRKVRCCERCASYPGRSLFCAQCRQEGGSRPRQRGPALSQALSAATGHVRWWEGASVSKDFGTCWPCAVTEVRQYIKKNTNNYPSAITPQWVRALLSWYFHHPERSSLKGRGQPDLGETKTRRLFKLSW